MSSNHELLILADHDAARWLGQYLEATDAYLVEVAKSGSFVPTSTLAGVGFGDTGTAMIGAGKPVYTWCSDDYDGRKLARDLHESIKGVHHIIHQAPAKWTGEGFDRILSTASRKKPPPIRKPQEQRSSSPRLDPREPVDVSPGAIAARVIQKFGDELLIVRLPNRLGRKSRRQTMFSTGFALGPKGIWEAGGDTWNRWLREIAADMRKEVLAAVGSLADTTAIRALNNIQRIRRPGMVQQVREMLLGELQGLQSEGEPCRNVTVCRAEDLDAKTRYMGADNGVVDLETGKLLPPEEGRHCLVTVHVPVDFDPQAEHRDVDSLFSHLEPPVRDWFWRVLGYHMRGSPSRRFYMVEGPKGGGKSTLANALSATLGPYCCRPQDSSLEVPKVSAGLNPEQLKFGPPHRFALFVELAITRTSKEGIKRKTGDDSQTVREPYEEEVEIKITATMFWFCNPGTAPRLRLQDEALAERLRVLPYPEVPEDQRDPRLVSRVETDEDFKRAFFARLVAAAASEELGEPPEEPEAVRKATEEKISDEIGEFGEFALRVVPDETARVTVAQVWSAWCEQCEASSEENEEVGGITRTRLSRVLREYVIGLPRPKLIKVDGGKQARGWRGWRLLTVEEAEALERPKGAKELLQETLSRMAEELHQITLTDEQLHRIIQSVPAERFEKIDRVFGSNLERAIESAVATPEGGKEWHLRLLRERDIDGVFLKDHDQIAAGEQEISELTTALMLSSGPQSEAYQKAVARYHKLGAAIRELYEDHDGDHAVSGSSGRAPGAAASDREDPGDTAPDDRSNGQSKLRRCAGCGTTEGQIFQRGLRNGSYDFACDSCAAVL